MALIRKGSNKNEKSSAPKEQKIRVSPYENPENVMELMAKICSATKSASIDKFWNVMQDAYNKKTKGFEESFSVFVKNNRKKFHCDDFYKKLNNFCKEIATELCVQENPEYAQVVVAGGFSSGKSSFLNRLTNSRGLLPTGVEPVSVVQTYLYCSKECRSISVKGVNLKDACVTLDTGVLQAIQHSKKSNIYLASVLNKLFVEIPSEEMNGIVFIDTPGYNNSDKANESNGKTDKQTALDALSEGNVLFWLVDGEHGTIRTDDIAMIKEFEGKKVIIFNKADKKGHDACKKIVEEASYNLYKEFPKEEIIDILAYSTLENEVYYSQKGKDLQTIIREVKSSMNGMSKINELEGRIKSLFEDEIKNCENTIEKAKEKHHRHVSLKTKWYNYYYEEKREIEKITKVCEKVIIPFQSKDSDLFKNITYRLQRLVDEYLKRYNEANEFCVEDLDVIERGEKMKESIRRYEEMFVYALKMAIGEYQKQNKPAYISTSEEDRHYNIFECIKKDDYKSFLHCFEGEIDISVCNSDGFNPLNLAVSLGNNGMVKFMLEHGADPFVRDKRGYNALHVAVENQFKDICEILIEKDSELVHTKTSQGETIKDLIEKNKNVFKNWIEKEINNVA